MTDHGTRVSVVSKSEAQQMWINVSCFTEIHTHVTASKIIEVSEWIFDDESKIEYVVTIFESDSAFHMSEFANAHREQNIKSMIKFATLEDAKREMITHI